MNKLKKQLWAKCVAMAIAVASGLASVIFAGAAVLVGIVPELQGSQKEYEQAFYQPILSTYAAVLWDQVEFAQDGTIIGGLDALEGGNIRYKVQTQECDYYGAENEENYTDLYANDNSLSTENCVASYRFEQGDYVHYNANTFAWAMRGARFWGSGSDTWWQSGSMDINEICYNETDGLFYFRAGDGYYIVPNFSFELFDAPEKENLLDGGVYTLETRDGERGYYTNPGTEPLAKEQVQEWADSGYCCLNFSEIEAVFGEASEDAVMTIRFMDEAIPARQQYALLSYNGDAEYMDCGWTDASERVIYRVLLAAAEEPKAGQTLASGHTDYLPEARVLAYKCYVLGQRCGAYLAGSLVLFIAAFVFLMSAAGWCREDDEIHLRWLDKIPFGIYTVIVVGITVFMMFFVAMLVEETYRYNEVGLGLMITGCVVPAALAVFLVLAYCMSIAVRLKAKKFCRYTICYYIWKPFAWFAQAIRENAKMYVKVGIWFVVIFIFELFIVASLNYNGDWVIFFILLKLIEIPVGIYLLWQMNRLWEGGRRIAAGDYSTPVNTRGMLWDMKKHAENLNSVSSGISLAVEERMKSERFKTELITNVSHDIKTPLTSIINYVDLIKKEDITDPTMLEYIAVLERQSARLKKLIEDLMEASKASTGNLSVNLEVCDATVMLSQVVGEFQGRAEENNLELIVESAEPPVEILADGRHLWRILDNLMSNVCKYAMPGTRVYIDLEVFHGMVIMTFRNISRTQLNISSEELMERFVRGDSSRNTEGNGLGLNIAQSLTALMNGNMAIQIDGDLFKAIVSFAQLQKE